LADYRIFLTSVYDLITEARLYEDTIGHIISEHPELPIELPSMLLAIKAAIANPSWIEASRTNVKSFIFVDANTTNRSGDPLRIPIKLIVGTSGLVKTAYFAKSPTFPRIIWRRNND
jgi:hypothetical protein